MSNIPMRNITGWSGYVGSYEPVSGLGGFGLVDPGTVTTGALCGSAKNTQQALKDLGYYSGPVDGIWGSGTVSAIKAFSTSHNLGSKSWSDPTFCSALKAALALAAAPPPVDQQGGSGSPVVTPGPGGTVILNPGASPPPPAPAPAPSFWDENKKVALIGGGAIAVVALIAWAITKGDKQPQMVANKAGPKKRRRMALKRRRKAERSHARELAKLKRSGGSRMKYFKRSMRRKNRAERHASAHGVGRYKYTKTGWLDAPQRRLPRHRLRGSEPARGVSSRHVGGREARGAVRAGHGGARSAGSAAVVLGRRRLRRRGRLRGLGCQCPQRQGAELAARSKRVKATS